MDLLEVCHDAMPYQMGGEYSSEILCSTPHGLCIAVLLSFVSRLKHTHISSRNSRNVSHIFHKSGGIGEANVVARRIFFCTWRLRFDSEKSFFSLSFS